MSEQKTVCPLCGSADVLIDAYASWDTRRQDWVLFNTFPDGETVCNECGELVSLSESWQEAS
jgi:RNA polymerase subunit RPABC4/transcription elongation factor Spt4